MKRMFLICAMLSFGGCTMCREHPVACAIGSAVIVGSIAAIAEHQHDERRAHVDPCSLTGRAAGGVIGSCVGK
jgi:hypothetical protein